MTRAAIGHRPLQSLPQAWEAASAPWLLPTPPTIPHAQLQHQGAHLDNTPSYTACGRFKFHSSAQVLILVFNGNWRLLQIEANKREATASLEAPSSPPCTPSMSSLFTSDAIPQSPKPSQTAASQDPHAPLIKAEVGFSMARSRESKCLDICLSISFQKQVRGKKPSLSKASSRCSGLGGFHPVPGNTLGHPGHHSRHPTPHTLSPNYPPPNPATCPTW